ncbi:MAG TPA: hypothetical protein VJU54_11140 [Nitrospiraceae bacterium]|nr:hypothetical protein [Nitrospiraceae bacterium]
MLKITQQQDPMSESTTLLILEGRLGGPWVDELDTCWRQLAANSVGGSMVDLTGVTFVDEKGKVLLTRMWEGGAEFRATGCLTRCLVEEITRAGRTDSSRVNRKGKSSGS